MDNLLNTNQDFEDLNMTPNLFKPLAPYGVSVDETGIGFVEVSGIQYAICTDTGSPVDVFTTNTDKEQCYQFSNMEEAAEFFKGKSDVA